MSTFEEIVKRHSTSLQENMLSFKRLVALVEQVESQEIIVESEDAPRSLVYRPIVVDRNWMNDGKKALSSSQYRRIKASVKNLGLYGIGDFETWINEVNSMMDTSGDPDVSNHSAAIARVDTLRTFYHLLKGPNAQAAGTDFEHFLATMFDGKVLKHSSEGEGVNDVLFSNIGISVKLLVPNGDIKGSIDDARETIGKYGRASYIVGLKEEDTVAFFIFELTEAALEKVIEDGKIRPGRQSDQLRIPVSYISRNKELLNYYALPTLDVSNALEMTERIFAALDSKFKNLFGQLQDLVEQVDNLMYSATDPDKTRKSARSAAGKAGTVRDTSTDIEREA